MTAELFKNNYEANVAFQILKLSNIPVSIMGKAGTGKSTFIEWAKTITPDCLVLAPTGLAAQNIGGRTIHSAFKLPTRLIYPNERDFFLYQNYSEGFFAEMKQYKMVIIDEISMVNSSIMFLIDRILKRSCDNDEPFGGKKLLLVGDPLQLLPVIKNPGDIENLKSSFGGEYFFDSRLFKDKNVVRIELKEVYRQKDPSFCDILNDIRVGNSRYNSLGKINKRFYDFYSKRVPDDKLCDITLTFTNKAAKYNNEYSLNSLPGVIYRLNAEYWGSFDKEQCVAEESIEIKVGAKVMCIKNHGGGEYVNGTIGIIKDVGEETIVIEDLFGKEIKIEKAVWKNDEVVSKKTVKGKTFERKVVGTCKQFPIKLAWAITVHKSQGLTFDSIDIQNNGKVFAKSLLYVALSRCRTLEGIKLSIPIKSSDIQVDKRMEVFCDSAWGKQQLSEFLEEVTDNAILDELTELFTLRDLEESGRNIGFDLQKGSSEIIIERMLAFGSVTDEDPGLFRKAFLEVEKEPVKKPKTKLAKNLEWH